MIPAAVLVPVVDSPYLDRRASLDLKAALVLTADFVAVVGLDLTVYQVLMMVLIREASLANLYNMETQYRVSVGKECPMTG